MAFALAHWRMFLALLLASGLYVQHLQLDAADSARAAAAAQASLWQTKVTEQNQSIQALKDASDARDVKAQAAVATARAELVGDEARIKVLLTKEPKPGQDRCKAAQELIWNTIHADGNGDANGDGNGDANGGDQ